MSKEMQYRLDVYVNDECNKDVSYQVSKRSAGCHNSTVIERGLHKVGFAIVYHGNVQENYKVFMSDSEFNVGFVFVEDEFFNFGVGHTVNCAIRSLTSTTPEINRHESEGFTVYRYKGVLCPEMYTDGFDVFSLEKQLPAFEDTEEDDVDEIADEFFGDTEEGDEDEI